MERRKASNCSPHDMRELTIARLFGLIKILQRPSRRGGLIAIALYLLATSATATAPGVVRSSTDTPQICDQANDSDAEDLHDKPYASAFEAAEAGETQLSSRLAVDSLCRAIRDATAGTDDRTRLAIYAVERLLDTGDLNQAQRLSEFIREQNEGHVNRSKADEIRLTLTRARILSARDMNRDALELRRSVRIDVEKIFGKQSEEAIENQLRIANLDVETGNVGQGIAELDDLSRATARPPQISVRLSRLIARSHALALAVSGEEREAISELQRIREENPKSRHSQSVNQLDIDLLEDIASVELRSNRLDEAITDESKVLIWRIKKEDSENPKLLKSMWRLAYLYIANQRLETAREILLYLRQKLTRNPDIYSKQLMLQTSSRLASIDASRGKFKTAAMEWKTVYEGFRNILGDLSVDTQVEGMNLALSLLEQGDTSNACSIISSIYANQSATRPTDHWSLDLTEVAYSDCLLNSDNQAIRRSAFNAIESVWRHRKQEARSPNQHSLFILSMYARAATSIGDLPKAKELLKEFVLESEAARRNSLVSAWGGHTFQYGWFDRSWMAGGSVLGYRDLAYIHARDGEFENALIVSELARDRALRDQIANQHWRDVNLTLSQRAELSGVIEQLQSINERIAVTASIVDRIELEAERTLATARLRALEGDFAGSGTRFEDDAEQMQVSKIKLSLESSIALVSVLHSGSTWWAVVFEGGEAPKFLDFSQAEIGSTADAWLRRLRGEPVRAWPIEGGHLAVSMVRPDHATGPYLSQDELGARLERGLMQPIIGALRHARHLVIVADDELVGVPLQALPLDGGLVLDRYEISYAPSLTTYFHLKAEGDRRVHPRDLLAIGAIDYPAVQPPATDDPITLGMAYAGAHPLPHAAEEIRDIAAAFPASRVTTWTGLAASKDALRAASRSGDLERYRYVHLATHAWAQPDQPEASAIALAGTPDLLTTQRAMTAAELSGLHMGADLLVLSACDTGVGRFEHGQGLLGMAYAALASGNRAALLSLWEIPDDTTALFMKDLYRRLRQGLDPVAALAQTQRAFRHSRDPRLSAPAAWAPFVVYGGY